MVFIVNSLFSQDLYDIKLNNCRTIKQKSEKIEILGLNQIVEVYKIRAKIEVQTRCKGPFAEPKFKKRRTGCILYTARDKNSTYLKNIIDSLDLYWKDKEEWSKKYNPSGDFSHLPVSSSFFISDSISVPYISTDHQRKGAYSIYYFNNRIYKFVLIKSRGFGSLSSIEEECLTFIKNNEQIELKEYVRQLDKALELIIKNSQQMYKSH